MLVYGLRLFVALITFGVGLAASALLGSGSPARPERRVVTGYAPVLSAAPSLEAPRLHPRTECYLNQFTRTVISGGILNGKAVSKPVPFYPAEAKAAGVSGTVVVKVVLDESGRVETAEAVSGPFMLRGAAEDAARLAQFSPTLLSGQPVGVSGVITYNFILR
jgi:TonB family protein